LSRSGLTIGALTALLVLGACLAVLATGHLDEDAYILYTYSANLATGHGIVWDQVHGPAEGATDFLWMVLLAGLRYRGVDLGAAAALLNALGLALSFYSISRLADLEGVAAHALLAAALLLSHLTAASLGGFSAHFYCGVFALACCFAVRRQYAALAFALLALGLVRPDGVILAFGIFAAVCVYERREVLRHGGYFLLAVLLAGAYFVWRWWYFGLLLPLPLIVKGHALSPLAGVIRNTWPLIPLGGVLALILWQRRALGARLLLIGSGPVLLFVALACANQMQNLSFRFQAPITLAIVALGFCAGRDRTGILALALLPWLAFGVRSIEREARPLLTPDYVNYLPQMLNPLLGPDARVALTEAGRFGYRLDAGKLDLVGLNSPDIARGASREHALAAFHPDLVFFHQVWTLDTSSLDSSRNWILLSREQYLKLPVLDSPVSSYHTDPTHLGAMAARSFIATDGADYLIYAVSYRGEFSHFYLLRPGGALSRAAFERALTRSFEPASVHPHCAYSDGFPCRLLASPAPTTGAAIGRRPVIAVSSVGHSVQCSPR
jgi:hypothetical protein